MVSLLQVIQLLNAMHLGQYQDNFMQEQVDGELLMELDEHILEHDLNVGTAMRVKWSMCVHWLRKVVN